jgi:hypothetical protein
VGVEPLIGGLLPTACDPPPPHATTTSSSPDKSAARVAWPGREARIIDVVLVDVRDGAVIHLLEFLGPHHQDVELVD